MLMKMWNNKNSHLLLKWMQNGTDTMEVSLTKVNIVLPCDLATMLLGIYSNGFKHYIFTKPSHKCS